VHVRAKEILVREIEPRRSNLGGDHELRPAKEVLVVRISSRAVVEDEGRLAASACTAAPLRVVRRGRRDVPHVDDVELGDIHAELHRRRAEEQRKLPFTEGVFSLLTLGRRHLGRVFPGAETLAVGSDSFVEPDKEGVRSPTVRGRRRNPDRVVIRAGTVAGHPAEHARCELVAGDVLVVARLRDLDHETCYTERSQQAEDYALRVVEGQTVGASIWEGRAPAEVLDEAATS
jgi:hypothetical protein